MTATFLCTCTKVYKLLLSLKLSTFHLYHVKIINNACTAKLLGKNIKENMIIAC